MRNRSDTYINIYNKMREDRLQEIIELKREVNDLKRMVEYLCKKVFE